MRSDNGGPRGGPMVWLMAVIVIALAAKVDSTTANIAVLALCAYAMSSHSRS